MGQYNGASPKIRPVPKSRQKLVIRPSSVSTNLVFRRKILGARANGIPPRSTPAVPFLYLIGHSDFLNFPANFFVVSYSCFMILLAAALSASSASPSTKSCLSVLTLFLTSLFAAFVALVRLLLTAPFLSFLICIFVIVSAEIQPFCCGFLLPSTSSHVVFTASLM